MLIMAGTPSMEIVVEVRLNGVVVADVVAADDEAGWIEARVPGAVQLPSGFWPTQRARGDVRIVTVFDRDADDDDAEGGF